MEKYKIHLTLTFENREIANDFWTKLKENKYVTCLTPEVVNDDPTATYPIAKVTFGGVQTFTYRLEKPEEVGTCRKFPTKFGLRLGTVAEFAYLTRQQVDKLYPFDQIQVIRNSNGWPFK